MAGRVLGGRDLDGGSRLPPHIPQGPQTLTHAKKEGSWVSKCTAALSEGHSKVSQRSVEGLTGPVKAMYLRIF